ncbi:MAG: hypothetical protein WCI29_13560 [Actinomycetes bacterium]
MYAWIWNKLPGRRPVKALLSAALFAGVVVLLFTLVFPWLDSQFSFSGASIDGGASAPAPSQTGETSSLPSAMPS